MKLLRPCFTALAAFALVAGAQALTLTSPQGGVNDAKHLGWFAAFMKSFDKFEGATLSERIQKYVLWLGFTQQDIDTIRCILLE